MHIQGLAHICVVYFAVNHANNDAVVQLQVYESMPHVFFLFEGHLSSKTVFSELVDFIRAATHGRAMETRFQSVNGKGVVREESLALEKYPTSYAKTEVLQFSTLLMVAS